MAHQSTIVENGMTYNVTEFDHTAQEIDDAVSNLGGASTPQGAIAALGAGVRPKLNINPFFTVNQRNLSQYIGPGYGPDGWRIMDSHRLDVISGGVRITENGSSNTSLLMVQYLDTDVMAKYVGLKMTVAVHITQNSMSQNTHIRLGETGIGSIPAGGVGLFYATGLAPQNKESTYIGLQANDREGQNGQTITVEAMTIEPGENQTLMYQDGDGVLHYLESLDPLEVQRCQKLYEPAVIHRASARAPSNASTLLLYYPFLTQKRIVPSLIINSLTNCLTRYSNGASSGGVTPTSLNAELGLAGARLQFSGDFNIDSEYGLRVDRAFGFSAELG